MDGVGVSRIVHYKDEHEDNCKAAIIVHDFKQDNGLVNLRVFYDGINDANAGMVDDWKTSVEFGDGNHQWHWPERV